MIYATKTDVAQYLHQEETELPKDIDRLLERASELIDYVTMGRARHVLDEEILELLKKATCGQVEYWMEAGESVMDMGNIANYSVGGFSISYKNEDGAGNKAMSLSPRARASLMLSGLLSRAVGMK